MLISKSGDLTELVCSSATILVKFELKHALAIQSQNILSVDDQTIQVTPLKVSGYRNATDLQNINSQKNVLQAYAEYELDYFKNDLHTELINPNNQWVITKSKGWFIWYFKVGSVPVNVAKQVKIQLFASTIVGDNILTINAPIFTESDFTKAGLIVNEMMETLTILKQ
ncbi:hypothetical protein ACFS5N_10205 [Mucilaginibacter ximonensis]|uniref:Uncharacterized protein n=1 Tax=Mucilaginibacter ximonensis TaxID=538021 RepID=A0ABW5YC55_9SPHI